MLQDSGRMPGTGSSENPGLANSIRFTRYDQTGATQFLLCGRAVSLAREANANGFSNGDEDREGVERWSSDLRLATT